MMWLATPGGEGKLTSERRWASISGFNGNSHGAERLIAYTGLASAGQVT
jgi:hypothetical protein